MKMRSILFLLVLLHTSFVSNAQNVNFYPKEMLQETCFKCNGSGQICFPSPRGYVSSVLPCDVCHGSGQQYSPYYYYNCGSAAGLISRGAQLIANQKYREAWMTFQMLKSKSQLHNRGGEACYWLGVCNELGYGVEQNTTAARSYYKLSKILEYQPAFKALQRIETHGFYDATEKNRRQFIDNYWKQVEIEAEVYRLMNEDN